MPQAGQQRSTPKQIFSTRERLEAAIENAIAMLDALDGNPDIEDGGESEPGPEEETTAFYWTGGGDNGERPRAEGGAARRSRNREP